MRHMVREGLNAPIVAIGLQIPSINTVLQISDETLINDSLAQRWVRHRPGQFNTPHHVAVHPVGTGEEQIFNTITSKIKNPGVL
jgi:hypothetical protein